jgi:hypothetical protein
MRTRIGLSELGLGLAISFINTAIFSLIFQDIILGLISASLAVAMLTDLVLSLYLYRKCRVETHLEKDSVWVWERVKITIFSKGCSSNIELRDHPSWISVKEVESIGKGSSRITAEAKFKHFGIYILSKVRIDMPSIMKIYILGRYIDIGKSIKVYPEYLYWIYRILRLLGISGAVSSAPQNPSTSPPLLKIPIFRTDSGEYYYTREYSPGDTLRRVDWKATARRLILMIKDLRESSEEGLYIAWDPRCLGPYTCDCVASSLLSTAYLTYQRGISPVYVYNIAEGRVYTYTDPPSMLRSVLKDVIEGIVLIKNPEDLYEYVEPIEFQRILRILGVGEDRGSRSGIDTNRYPQGFSRDIVAISDLVNGSSDLIDALSSMQIRELGCVVIAPSEPWIDADDLETMYVVSRTSMLAIRSLKRIGCRVFLKVDSGFIGG